MSKNFVQVGAMLVLLGGLVFGLYAVQQPTSSNSQASGLRSTVQSVNHIVVPSTFPTPQVTKSDQKHLAKNGILCDANPVVSSSYSGSCTVGGSQDNNKKNNKNNSKVSGFTSVTITCQNGNSTTLGSQCQTSSKLAAMGTVYCENNLSCHLDFSGFQDPAVFPAGAKLRCVYSNPIVNNGAAQVTGNKGCPSGWTCDLPASGVTTSFAGVKYGECNPPSGFDPYTTVLPCTPDQNSIYGAGCPAQGGKGKWGCVPLSSGGGVCAAPAGFSFTTPGNGAQACTPNANNVQSTCDTGYVCLPSPAGGYCFKTATE